MSSTHRSRKKQNLHRAGAHRYPQLLSATLPSTIFPQFGYSTRRHSWSQLPWSQLPYSQRVSATVANVFVATKLYNVTLHCIKLGCLFRCYLRYFEQRSLHANGEPVLGRRHTCENKLLSTYGRLYKLKH